MTDMAFNLFSPPILILYGMVMVLLVEILAPRQTARQVRRLSPTLALLTLLITLIFIALRWNGATAAEGFAGMIVLDRFALFAMGVLCTAGALSVLSAWNYLTTVDEDHGEYYVLLLGAVFGGMVMVGAADLLMIFIGLEIMSISLYVLCGFLRRRDESGESALKYFLLGAFATGFLLYGVALLFGATGSTHLADIAGAEKSTLLLAGMALLLVGFGFKIAAFPFHVWTPDVYQGAPGPVSGFMAAAVKAAAFATLLRVLVVALEPLRVEWAYVLYYVAIATMVFGNIAALVQNHLKRLLAYSSIAHAGYLLVGVVAMIRQEQAGAGAVLFYLLAYTLMTVGAFAIVAHLSRREADADNLDGYRGLARRHPWLAACLTIFLISLAGIPPLIGFPGKFALFSAAVKANLIDLVVIGVLTSALSVYYYIRVVYLMYMTEAAEGAPAVEASALDWPGRVALAVTGVLTLLLGIAPGRLLELAGQGAAMLLGL
ncbi:MAG TPA: NADH-quinone oxidoreductase subunit N [bacterium]|nr:NADH-quinone oxidoreductase subunit N [bacterium]